MRYELLGPLRVIVDHRETAMPRRERAFLAMLLLHPDRTVSVDQLVDAIWGARASQTARSQLQGLVYRLRGQLAAAGAADQLIVTEPGGYRIATGPARMDVTQFRRLVAQARESARAGRYDQASTHFRAALGQWRGPALADIESDRIRQAAAALDEERTQAHIECLDSELAAGRSGELVAELTDLVNQFPHREELHRILILTLYRAGRHADALAAFRRVRQLLQDELGVEPGAELQQLYHAILNRDPTLDRASGAPAVAAPPPRELPADVAGFTGRADLLKALDEFVSEPGSAVGPVVISAVAGTAGVGKTALAVRWAHRVADRFPDGQLFVNLRGYDREQPVSPAEALARLLASLGVAHQDIPVEVEQRAAQYRSVVAGRRMLIVLDNAAAANQVRPLLPGSGTCVVLVTSRDSLAGLVARNGASRLVVDVLPATEAAMLLRQLVGPRADTEPDAVAVLAEQCSRLPLALRVAAELAVSRPTSSLAELVVELSDLRRRLELLYAGDDPHAAVSVVFSWSVQHLPADTARSFRRLGLHPGPDFDPYAVAATADIGLADAERDLDRLVRAHLVQPTGRGRYAMHDLLRAYTAQLVAAEDNDEQRAAARDRLFDYYLAAATAAMDAWNPAEANRRPRAQPVTTPAPDLTDPDAARAWLDANRASLVAVAAATAHDRHAHTFRLSTTLFRYLQGGGHYVDALAIYGYARLASEQVGDLRERARALRHMGAIHHQMSRYETAADHLRQALAIFQEVGDQDGEATALNNLAVAEERLGNYRTATEHYQRALDIFRQVGELSGVANTLNGLGVLEEWHGDYARAADYYRQAMAMFEQLGNQPGEALVRHNLGNVEERLGSYEAAAEQQQRAFAICQAIGNPQLLANALDGLGSVQLRLGHPKRAIAHFERALEVFRGIGDRDGEPQALVLLGEAERARGNWQAALAHYTAALLLATTHSVRDVAAHTHTGMARTYHAVGDTTSARGHYEQARQIYTELGRPEAEVVRAELAALDTDPMSTNHSEPGTG